MPGSLPVAFLSEDSQVLDLTAMLDPATGAGWTILVANAINNRGQIACSARDPAGQSAACILTPMAAQ